MSKALVSVFLFLMVAMQSSGWGPTGHRAAGWIAEKYLNKKARSAIEKILQGQSLAMASTWMDEIRSDSTYDYMVDWHWVTIPEGQSYEMTLKNPNGDIIQTLERIIGDLKAKKLTGRQELESVKLLIHLIGDIHQPLHVGARADRGGNDIQVMWFRNYSNLHRIWDSDMIDDTRLSYTELAQSLDKPTEEQLRAWQKTSIHEWAKESQSYQEQVYNYGNGKLGYDYAYINYPIVRHRLLRAGVRLAGVLNEIYG
ncbi:MAG: S1/P1 nuclease [Cyclobacteriaceae bacterium]